MLEESEKVLQVWLIPHILPAVDRHPKDKKIIKKS